MNHCSPSESPSELFFLCLFYELLFSCLPGQTNPPAELPDLLQLRQLETPATAALHSLIVSQLQGQHLWDIQRNLPKMQSFIVFAFHRLPLISPFIRLDKTRFNSSYHWASEGFPSPGFSGEEFGVNGPGCDAVAKKPWLGSWCPFAVWRVPPWWTHLCFSLSACPEQGVLCSQLAWLSPLQNEVGSNFPCFLLTFTLAFWSPEPPPALARCLQPIRYLLSGTGCAAAYSWS